MIESIEWLKSLPEAKGILKEIQIKGRKLMQSITSPNKNLEEWRLTDLKRIENFLNIQISSKKNYNSTNSDYSLINPPKNALRILVDEENLGSIELTPNLKKITSKELENKLSVNKNMTSIKNNWSVAINESSSSKILALKVLANSKESIELIIRSKENKYIPSRIMLVVEENAKLDLLQVIIGEAISAQSCLIEIFLEKGAEVKHGLIALGQEQSSLLANLDIHQSANSTYSQTAFQYRWELSRLESRINQTDGKANTILKGLQISTNNQQLETLSKVRFNGPEGSLDQLQKSVATDNSHCIFNGGVQVPQIAQQTNAAQLSRNILLSKKARIDTKPELEIIADDVRCTHGATVSQLQEDELFYLRSRGINNQQATSLLIKGYCEEILNTLPVDANRWQILDTVLEGIKK